MNKYSVTIENGPQVDTIISHNQVRLNQQPLQYLSHADMHAFKAPSQSIPLFETPGRSLGYPDSDTAASAQTQSSYYQPNLYQTPVRYSRSAGYPDLDTSVPAHVNQETSYYQFDSNQTPVRFPSCTNMHKNVSSFSIASNNPAKPPFTHSQFNSTHTYERHPLQISPFHLPNIQNNPSFDQMPPSNTRPRLPSVQALVNSISSSTSSSSGSENCDMVNIELGLSTSNSY